MRRLRSDLPKRIALPLGVVVAAVALGLLLFSPTASRQTNGVGNAVLASSSKTNRSAQLATGKTLFDETCSSCHGSGAEGSAVAPNLRGLGAGTVDLWVSSGWMPLAVPTEQPLKKPPRYDRAETIDIAEYVASLDDYKGFAIPTVNLKGSSVSSGFSIFAQNCAACHTITGAGDALSNGIVAPSLHDVTKTQVMEAVRTGPANMPRFGPGILSTSQVRDVIAYVTKDIQHPDDPGGLGLGGVGPVAEGFVGLFIGVGLCVLAAYWIGDRTPRGEDGVEQHGDDDGGSDGDGAGHPGPDGRSEGEREVEHA